MSLIFLGQDIVLRVAHAGYLAQLVSDEVDYLFDGSRPLGTTNIQIAGGASHMAGQGEDGSLRSHLTHPTLVKPGKTRRLKPHNQ